MRHSVWCLFHPHALIFFLSTHTDCNLLCVCVCFPGTKRVHEILLDRNKNRSKFYSSWRDIECNFGFFFMLWWLKIMPKIWSSKNYTHFIHCSFATIRTAEEKKIKQETGKIRLANFANGKIHFVHSRSMYDDFTVGAEIE